MIQKFILGLFDNPYIDVENATKVVGRADFKKLGEDTQRRSMTLLKNDLKLFSFFSVGNSNLNI